MTWSVPDYLVEELVGSGSTGEVWRARRRSDGEVVALKRIAIDDPELLRAARAEAALLAAFEHPHILALQELLIVDNEAILVLDYAAGGSLAEVLDHRGRLSAGEVVTIVAPIAAALSHAHSEGVVHGDLSPSNILFTADGRPLLADLGVARITGQLAGLVRATPAYIDPLVAAGGSPGPHSDVFSLAAVAWHALTGTAPWAGESVAESLDLASEGALASLRVASPATPGALADALDRALQSEAHLRGSAAELALDSRHAVTPIPVDGWTGRAATDSRVGRHCAPEEGEEDPEAHAPEDRAHGGSAAKERAENHGRPPFRRPDPEQGLAVSASARTRAARPASRSRQPAAAHAPLLARVGRRRRWAAAALSTAALLASVAAGTWWAHADVAADEPGRPVASASFPSSGYPPASASHPRAVPTQAQPSLAEPQDAAPADRWLARLTELDAVRQRAYTSNDPALLAQVYASQDLLAQDAAQLTAQVPSGCGLTGARTTYSGIQVVSADAERTRLLVTATLAQAHLTCSGTITATTAAAGPVRLSMSLAPGPDGAWLIEQQRLSG